MSVFVHSTAEVSKKAIVGDGTRIWNEAQVREGARIGKRCRLGKSVYIDKNVVVGDDCKIQNFATLYDGVSLGDGVFVGPHVCFVNDLYPRSKSTDWRIVRTKILDGVSIGANATILCGVTVGMNAMVGAGAVVTKNVPDHSLVIGNPARLAGYVCDCGRPVDRDLYCSKCGKTMNVKSSHRKRGRR